MQTNHETEGVSAQTESHLVETEIPSAGSVTVPASASTDPSGRTLDRAAQGDLAAREAELVHLERYIDQLRWADVLAAMIVAPGCFCAFGLALPPFSDSRFVALGCVALLIWFLIWREKRRVEALLALLGSDRAEGWPRADPG